MDDYISRDKAIELIQPRVKPSTVYGEGYLQAIEHVSDMLALMPAADVQPVKHGKRKIKMNDNLLYDLKDLRDEIGSLTLASNVNIFTLTYNAMVDKINEIIKKVEDNFYEKK